MKNFLLIFTVCWLVLAFFPAQAITLQMPLPGMSKTISDPGQYVRYLFTFGLSLIGFLAVGAIIIGGIMYMTAGSVGSVEKAKQYIIGALSGIALLLCSYLLLTTIDPTLKNLSPTGNLKQYNMPQAQQNIDSKMSQLKATTQTSYGCYLINGDELGAYSSTDDCQKNCPNGSCSVKQVKTTFFICMQKGGGQTYGPQYSSYADCQKSGCETEGDSCVFDETTK